MRVSNPWSGYEKIIINILEVAYVRRNVIISIMFIFSLSLIGLSTLTVRALDSTRDQDDYAVVWNGTMTAEEVRNAYDNGRQKSPNIGRIFRAMGISRSELNGSFVDGTVKKNGDVIVNGAVVATGATTAARNLGGTKISGTNAGIVPTSAMGDDQTAMVQLDQNGKFAFAVMKPCGNPVKATPVAPPAPKPEPQAKAACTSLSARTLNTNQVRLRAQATASDGASINGYTFVVRQSGAESFRQTVNSSASTASVVVPIQAPGTYTARVTANTTVGERRSESCVATFTIDQPEEPKHPDISVVKKVNDADSAAVRTNTPFTYQITVTNTGQTNLPAIALADTPEAGVTLLSSGTGSVSNNKWSYTIPSLRAGESIMLSLQATVNAYTADVLTNTVCVNTSPIPGDTDACDTADVTVTPPTTTVTQTEVCVIDEKVVRKVDSSSANDPKYTTTLSECNDEPVQTVAQLPETGPLSTAMQAIGAMSLVGSGSYYALSRRKI